jgi:hypothetical protein
MQQTFRLSGVMILATLELGGLLAANAAAEALPRSQEKPVVRLPDFGAELRAFNGPQERPVAWWPHVVNAAWGGGRGGPERSGGWLDKNWPLVDYLDRSGDYSTHGYLTHRGIWYEVYGSNEYQETIHFHEEGARKLLWDNGIAQDPTGQRVVSEDYNMKVKWWAEQIGWDAFISCNNAPRWSGIIGYDWLTSPLLGFAISQDNIGGPVSRIGAGGHGRYCDFCNEKFFHYLALTGRLPEFRRDWRHIRDYVRANLGDVLRRLPPNVPHRWDTAESELLARLAAPPVMSEYQKFLYLSHLHNFLRYYQDAKLLAGRLGREYDVHGNQGGSFIGPDPYQVALADFVDTVWFESSGISTYDVLKFGWNNSAGSLRYQMGQAMTGGRKPFMSMTAFLKHTPDLVEHEMAEACAGGGVLFVNQETFAGKPALEEKMTQYFRFRHAHRGIFATPGRSSCAQIALVYSIPTFMYRSYQYSGDAPPMNDLFGVARAMEEGHLPLDVVILNHPEIHADPVSLDQLKQYRLVILPAVECLSDRQIDLFSAYLRAGGTLGLVGDSGLRNEDNLPRSHSPLAAWRKAGQVVEILPGKTFLPVRAQESDRTRELTRTAIDSVRRLVGPDPILAGDLPRMVWVKAWRHGDSCLSLHLVNYQIDFSSGNARATSPVPITVALPKDLPAEEAAWLTPDGTAKPVTMAIEGTRVRLTVPSLRVYGVLLIGRKGLDQVASAAEQIKAMHARAAMASEGNWGDVAPAASAVCKACEDLAQRRIAAEHSETHVQAAVALCRAVQEKKDQEYQHSLREMASTKGAIRAFAFGAKQVESPWNSVSPTSDYSPSVGFGWTATADDTEPTPEEVYYDAVHRYGNGGAKEIAAGQLLFWPYKAPVPPPLRTNLACGGPRRFRVDVPPGDYRVRVVATNPSWIARNFLVSGMVSVNGQVKALDAALDRGSLRVQGFDGPAGADGFDCATPDGKLEFLFGGPTGWAVAAMVIEPIDKCRADPQELGALRSWRISPRYANPQWYPITQVAFSPEDRLARLPDPDWRQCTAAAGGLPVIDLGSNRQAEVCDVVYAATTIEASERRTARLHFGATSQAQLWLNGQPIGYLPNEKGLRRSEFALAITLLPGKNLLVAKLQRFWERRWMFYASVTK